MLIILLLLVLQPAQSAHLPSSTTDWTYGQYLLSNRTCRSNASSICEAYHQTASNNRQTILSLFYNSLSLETTTAAASNSQDQGEWTALNNLLKNVTLSLPDFTTSISKIGMTATIHISKLKCGGISVTDLKLIPERPDNENVDMTVTIWGLTLTCAAEWEIKTNLAVHGSGALTADSKGSGITSEVVLTSKDLRRYPPDVSKDASCKSNVLISDLAFTGGTMATILGWFKSTIITELTATLNPLLCSELSSLVDDTFASLLVNVSKIINPYLTDSALAPPDIAQRERFLLTRVPEDVHKRLVALPSNIWMQRIFNLTQTFLGWNVTEQDFGINIFAREFLNSGATLNFSNISAILFATNPHDTADIVDAEIMLESLAIIGLDSFDKVDLLHPLSALNYTLLNQFSMKKLEVDIGVRIRLTPRDGEVVGSRGKIGTDTIEEHVHFTVGMRDLRFNTTTVLAIDGQELSKTTMAKLFASPAGCLLKNIVIANITSLTLDIGTLTPIGVHNFVSLGLDELVDDLAESFTLAFYDSLLLALPSIAEHTIRPVLNTAIHQYLLNNATCPDVDIPPKGTIVNLLTSPTLIWVRQFLHDNIKVATLNSWINQAAHSQSGLWGGTIQVLGSLISLGGEQVNIPQIGHLSVDVGNLTISGLDTINHYAVFDPIGPKEVTDTISMSSPPSAPLLVHVDVHLTLIGHQVNITDDFTIGLNLTTLNVVLDTLLSLDGHWLAMMTLQDFTEHLGCSAAMVKDVRLVDNHTTINIEELRLLLSCDTCTSPDMPDFVRRTNNDTAQEQITAELNAFVERMLSKLYSKSVHDETMKEITKWTETCPQSGNNGSSTHTVSSPPPPLSPSSVPVPVPTPEHVDKCWDQKAAVVGTASSLAVLFLIFAVYHFYCRIGNTKKITRHVQLEDPLLPSSSFSSSHRRPRLLTQDYVLRDRNIPLYQHPSISIGVRVGVLIGILINFGLFLSGHLSVGASVDLVAHFAGDTLEYDTIYTFSLGSSLTDMWSACAIVLATLIGSFSGVWPYLKLVLMTFVWTAPPSILNTRRRGGLMQILDIMGKWSLIDLYVLVMSMIAFFVNIYSPELEILPTNFYLFSLWVTPVWGLYAFCIAVTSSLLLSHVQIVAHRNAVASDRQEVAQLRQSTESMHSGHNEDGDLPSSKTPSSLMYPKLRRTRRKSSWFDAGTLDLVGERRALVVAKEAVWNHVFHVENSQPALQLGFKKRGKFMVILLPFLSMSLLLWGAIVPSFRFEINGIAGLAQDFGRTNSSVIEYSMFMVMTRLLDQSNDATTTISFIGIRCVATLYILFSFIVPLCNYIVLIIMWTVPMRLRFQKKFFFASEILSSWSATEVYIIATVVAALEIGDISKQIIGDACDPLNPIFQLLNELDILETKDMLCFEVGASIQFGAYILLGASILAIISTQIITTLAEAAIEDRENRVKGETHDQATMTGCGHTILTFLIHRCIGCCVLKMNGFNEENMTEETFQHLRARRSSLSFAGTGGRTSMTSSVTSASDRGASFGGVVGGAGEDDCGELLPPGWTIMMDPDSRKAYYWNELNGKMTTLKPVWTRRFQRYNSVGSSGRASPPSMREKNGTNFFSTTPRSSTLGRVDEADEEERSSDYRGSSKNEIADRVHVRVRKVGDA